MLHTGTEKPEAIELAKLASGFSGNDRPQRRRRHENKIYFNYKPLERVSQSFFYQCCFAHRFNLMSLLNIFKPVYNIRYLLLLYIYSLWIAFLNGLKNTELGPLTPPR
jgi:hypothetical protein